MVKSKERVEFEKNITKERLEDLYINKKMNMTQIGEIFNVDHKVISNQLEKFNISKRNRKEICSMNKTKERIEFEKNITKEKLEDLYINKKMNMNQIGKIFNVDHKVISNQLEKFNIQKRSKSEAFFNKNNRNVNEWLNLIKDNEKCKITLNKLYIEKKMSLNQIGKMFNVNHNTIKNKLKKFNIQIRNRSEASFNIYNRNVNEWLNLIKDNEKCKITLNELYIEKKMGLDQISKMFNIDYGTVRNKLKEFDIETRTSIEQKDIIYNVSEKWIKTRNNIEEFYKDYLNFTIKSKRKPVMYEFSRLYPVNSKTFNQWVKKHDLLHLFDLDARKSSYELLFEDHLKSKDIKYEMEFSINNKRFDFKINDTLIEINPFETHNVTTKNKLFNSVKGNIKYHQEKSDLAKVNGYHCIHIFEDDLRDKLDKFSWFLPKKHIIGASKCKLHRNVNLKQFLDENHLQNAGTVHNGYALTYKDKIVACMTFNKSIRCKNENEVELVRYCVHRNYNIKFAAERLFKNFLKDNPLVDNIVSFCDTTYFSGDVYKKLGFEFIHSTKPQYYWIDKNEDGLLVKKHRMNYQKSKLQKRFGLSNDYIKNHTETQICEENGLLKIYTCKQDKYLFTRN